LRKIGILGLILTGQFFRPKTALIWGAHL